jgi:hypothetical protein
MRKAEQCRSYHQELERSRRRMTDLQEHGVEALSRFDREIAYGGDAERAIQMSTWLVGNHIAYFTEKLSHCDEPAQQITLFDVARASNDPSSP